MKFHKLFVIPYEVTEWLPSLICKKSYNTMMYKLGGILVPVKNNAAILIQ